MDATRTAIQAVLLAALQGAETQAKAAGGESLEEVAEAYSRATVGLMTAAVAALGMLQSYDHDHVPQAMDPAAVGR